MFYNPLPYVGVYMGLAIAILFILIAVFGSLNQISNQMQKQLEGLQVFAHYNQHYLMMYR